ncbi:beta-1,4-glucuronyltransferase 1-like [Schistocerca serialis cubense]|uniref:beta-1,4-glucuronyltransferase 1-like n=1 Tax=Schistocerca serialis cubense TaxID=2023355 RepID=UPI00214F0E92|nr:beta-1,4-glucuronyltransferase 1-like [Schistocerca serialis cubense]
MHLGESDVGDAFLPGDGLASLADLIKCYEKPWEPRTQQRGSHWVLYNYVRAKKRFRCWETVTLTTHADFRRLGSLRTLVARWRGPVSLVLFVPPGDFGHALDALRWARDCWSQVVAYYVTFHVLFSEGGVPAYVPCPAQAAVRGLSDCSVEPPWQSAPPRSGGLYPVNVARNVAREAATTHYVLPVDIELFPSPGLLPDFLHMLRRHEAPLRRPNPRVFTLPVFEIEAGATPPENKASLLSMLNNGSAIIFHQELCGKCHRFPGYEVWKTMNVTEGLSVFHIGKRVNYFRHWEPIFIGTQDDPLYDERFSWEGKSDKMTQGYIMCVMDYDFDILDNAFLIHEPGIKTKEMNHSRLVVIRKSNALKRDVAISEFKVLFGEKYGCVL